MIKEENNKEYVLLQRRYNTGILDGKYDAFCSGHIEKNESLTEAKEEINAKINNEDLNYSSLYMLTLTK